MLRKIVLITFALVAIGGYLLLFPPLPLPPEIGRGLSRNFSDADQEFKRRVTSEFPLPMNVQDLVLQLARQGFTIDIKNQYAVFKKGSFPCTLTWRVYWEAENDTVNNLSSKYGGTCL